MVKNIAYIMNREYIYDMSIRDPGLYYCRGAHPELVDILCQHILHRCRCYYLSSPVSLSSTPDACYYKVYNHKPQLPHQGGPLHF